MPARARTALCAAQAPCSEPAFSVTVFSPGKPVPEHVSLYVCAVAPSNCTVVDPERAGDPDHAPPAVQLEAFDVDQVRVALCPGMTDAGVILMLTDAGGAG